MLSCNTGPKAALTKIMRSAGIGMTFSVVLRWAREQCCNLALTGHWIWATPWRGVTWGEVVLCSRGSFQGGLTADSTSSPQTRSKSFLGWGSGLYITMLPPGPDQIISWRIALNIHIWMLSESGTEETFQLYFFPNINSYPVELVFHRT